MTHRRVFALLASLVGMLAMMLGSTATAAQAERRHYPPTPPSLSVDRGSVRKGETVRAYGSYARNERVYITVTFRANGSHRWRTIRTAVVKADRRGRFTFSVRTSTAGTLLIKARGKGTSSEGGSVVVQVRDRRGGGHHGGRPTRRIAFTTTSTVAAPPANQSSDIAIITIAGLLALTAGAAATRHTIRRRRRN